MELEAVIALLSHIVPSVANTFMEMIKAKAREKDISIPEERLRQLEEKVAVFDSIFQEIISDFEDLGWCDKDLARLHYEQEIEPKGSLLRFRGLMKKSLEETLEKSHRKENSASLKQEKKGKD